MIDCAVPCIIISCRSRNKGGLIDKSEKHFFELSLFESQNIIVYPVHLFRKYEI